MESANDLGSHREHPGTEVALDGLREHKIHDMVEEVCMIVE
jgi:hypothetical protein